MNAIIQATKQIIFKDPTRQNILEVTYRPEHSFSVLIPKFVDYAKVDLSLGEQTVIKYADALSWVVRDLPEINYPAQLTIDHISELKRKMLIRKCGESRINSVIFALRKFLEYCQKRVQIKTLNIKEIEPMRVPKKEVIFLNKPEIKSLRSIFNINNKREFRMQTLVEFLLGTGMRISEALSVNRDEIDFENQQVKIIGKGKKERVVLISDEAIKWVKMYLESRKDENPPLFVAFGSKERLTGDDLGSLLRSYAKRAGIKKKLTPHILRHTAATIMMENGCPLTYIQQMLGHADIKTTAKYYLGVDKKSLKEAHGKYLKYD